MSRDVTVYSVAPDPLLRGLGSRSPSLKAALQAADEDQLRAARQLVDGTTPTDPPPAVIHGFELLCRNAGRLVPSNGISPLHSDFLSRLDQELAVRQFPFTISKLIMGGGPARLPWADDFPTVGHVEPMLVQVAAQFLKVRPLSSNDSDIETAFADVTDWVEVATSRGDMLVGFWY